MRLIERSTFAELVLFLPVLTFIQQTNLVVVPTKTSLNGGPPMVIAFDRRGYLVPIGQLRCPLLSSIPGFLVSSLGSIFADQRSFDPTRSRNESPVYWLHLDVIREGYRWQYIYIIEGFHEISSWNIWVSLTTHCWIPKQQSIFLKPMPIPTTRGSTVVIVAATWITMKCELFEGSSIDIFPSQSSKSLALQFLNHAGRAERIESHWDG